MYLISVLAVLATTAADGKTYQVVNLVMTFLADEDPSDSPVAGAARPCSPG